MSDSWPAPGCARHGRRWCSKTPRPERVLLKLGELTPASEDVPPMPPQQTEKPKSPAVTH
ncbi:hypothetical protein [Streptomyces thermolineatus]|uniref:hypothetical protein n=1 Tax=Streptomyces thermolineatus TaxID=44033 RepID=UPI0038501E6C